MSWSVTGRDKSTITEHTEITYLKSGANTYKSSRSVELAMSDWKTKIQKYCGADKGMSCSCVNFTGRLEYVAGHPEPGANRPGCNVFHVYHQYVHKRISNKKALINF